MPTIDIKHPQGPERAATSFLRGSEVDRYFRGPDSQLLAAVAERIREALQEFYLRGMAPVEANEDLDYRPVPPNRTFNVRVRYQFQGPGEPLPFPLEDG
jgi:hypothetical protein